MTRPRLVTLGRPGAPWPRAVAGWAAHAELAAAVTTCLDPVELRAHLADDDRPPAVAVADLGYWRAEPGLAADAQARGVVTVAVADGPVDRLPTVTAAPTDAGVEVVLPPDFGPAHLDRALATARRRPPLVDVPVRPRPAATPPSGRLVVVTGPPGAGASTVAQALATHHAGSATTVLADLALDADQHVRHGVGEDHRGLGDLTDALAGGADDGSVPTVPVDGGYTLLPGGPPAGDDGLSPGLADAVVDRLRRQAEVVVADVSVGDHGRPPAGAHEPGDRHGLTRAALDAAAEILVVGDCSTTGIHRLAATLVRVGRSEARRAGLRPVLNRVPGPRPRRRSVAEEVAHLLDLVDGDGWPVPACLPYDRRIEPAVRRAAPLPARFVRAVAPAAGGAGR